MSDPKKVFWYDVFEMCIKDYKFEVQEYIDSHLDECPDRTFRAVWNRASDKTKADLIGCIHNRVMNDILDKTCVNYVMDRNVFVMNE